MPSSWTDDAIRYLTDWTACPRCRSTAIVDGVCSACSADLTRPEAVAVADSSRSVVAALQAREAVIARLVDYKVPAAAAAATASATVAAPVVVPPPALAPKPVATAPRPSSQLSLQSVLAVAGAGLFAIAAIVFTFFNPDLTDFDTRTTIVAIVTAVFLGGAWALARLHLQVSAETVGALGMVFVVLDIWAFSTAVSPGIDEWTGAAIGTLVAAAVMILVGWLARIRTWLWTGVLGAMLVPTFFGWGLENDWLAVLGYLATGFVAVAVIALARVFSNRFSSPMAAERVTATIVIGLAQIFTVVLLITTEPPAGLDPELARAGVLATLAVLSALATLGYLSAFWSILSGASAAVAGAFAVAAFELDRDWIFAALPAAASVVLVLVALLVPRVRLARLRPVPTLVGAFSVAFALAVPTGLLALVQVFDRSEYAPGAEFGLICVVALGSVTAATALMALLSRKVSPRFSAVFFAVSLWFAWYVLLALVSWPALVPAVQVGLGIGIAVALALLVKFVPKVSAAPLRIRVPILVGAHVLLLYAAATAWQEDTLSVVGGAAVAVAIGLLAITLPAAARFIHVGLGFAYALIVFAHALDLAGLDAIIVQSLTATLAFTVALVATFVYRLPVRYWYTILGVSVVPLVVSIGWVFAEISGWTALSTGVLFLLAVALFALRRPGLSIWLRATAATLLVPALSVIVLTLGAQFLAASASPIVLPIIAGIVGIVLPCTLAIGRWLEARGLSVQDARITRLAIEGSALLTAAIAVVLALVRGAAGFDISFYVLAIISLSGAATALFSNRWYGWVISFSAATGALWSLLAFFDVRILELYLLPPSVAAALIGAIAVARGRRGRWFYAAGLGVAILPSLGLLAAFGYSDELGPWRLWGLLAASAVLVGFGFVTRAVSRLSSLQLPTLLAAIVAAAAGAIGAMRFGLELDSLGFAEAPNPILPALALGSIAALLAAAAGMLIEKSESRWAYSPAFVYLVVGPIAQPVRFHDVLSTWTVFALELAILAVMVLVALLARSRPVTLPPVWFLFGIAWCVGVAGWSTRLLNVEPFSLPMGLALIAAGVIAGWAGATRVPQPTFNSWPNGFHGSWALLAPGIVVTLLPSVIATGTNPATWRAILVIVLALISILLGLRLKRAALFILGIAALPLENLVVFGVQLSGGGIESSQWWITLASAGAVLLVIAVSSERRASGERGGVAARIRDLS